MASAAETSVPISAAIVESLSFLGANPLARVITAAFFDAHRPQPTKHNVGCRNVIAITLK
jgi:hypothetical protein